MTILSAIGVGLLVLLAARFLIIFDVSIGGEKGLAVVVRLLASFVPHYLAFMLPLGIYLGCYAVVRSLAVNSELAILQASGISLLRIFAPFVALGICVTLINLVVIGWLEPLGRYSYRGLIYKLEQEGFYLKARDGTFMKVGAKTVLIDKIQSDRRSFNTIFIFEPLEEGGTKTITATNGELVFTGRNPVLRLHDGQQLKVNALDDGESRQHLDFAVLDLPLDDVITSYRPRGDDEQELLLPELISAPTPEDTTPEAMSSELNRKLVIILSTLFMPLLGASLAVLNPRRRNVYQTAGVVLLIALYHQLVEFGAGLVEKTGLSPLVALWPIFFLFCAGSVYLFHAVSHRPGSIDEYLGNLAAGIAAVPGRVFRSQPAQ